MVSSITHAIRGRDLLKQKGFKASIQKTPGGLDTAGCGYSIFVDKNLVPKGLNRILEYNVEV